MNMLDRIEDPESDLYKIRAQHFELQYRASSLAGEELQAVIRRAGDTTEIAAIHLYDENDSAERIEFQSEIKRAFAISRSLEDAARAELELPPRGKQRPTNDDLHVGMLAER